MSSALILYGSSTGNTEFAAETIGDFLTNKGYAVSLFNVTEVSAEILKETFDLYLLGSSTWGDDEIELQEDFDSFYTDITGDLSLSGKNMAVFGCGDSSYTYFCGAVDVIEERIRLLGGNLVCEALRIDGDPETEEIEEWIEEVINAK